ncbi:metabolite traffic protein EboE [Reichenbachiella sp. MALMAid0571]|uniref:metabolite traffic protein EboE n=1 Tax=Reichenbachiella sp. MALMAid0571 TaxID=3143939 RepID=UPI0032DF6915
MRINKHQAHLTYCSNIHAGEPWTATFSNLKEYTTKIRDGLTSESFGIGLRLSNEASLEILEGNNLNDFKSWLTSENMYVFTINGFPYGGFHNQVVKDDVHTPDWTTTDRLEYTKRLFDILAQLLPENMDGGVSTSPISYRFWHKDDQALENAKNTACTQLTDLIVYLSEIKTQTGKSLHLDMEPEPDGILETTQEFVDFFNNYILKKGIESIKTTFNCDSTHAEAIIREHFQLCYDVCHFAVGYENPKEAINKVLSENIKIGRIQISAALGSGSMRSESQKTIVKQQLKKFDEPTYLHQAVVKKTDGELVRFPDLGIALDSLDNPEYAEIRTHYHVPVFTEKYEQLVSTQQDIIETLAVWSEKNFTNHLEVETYTWDVLPENMRTDIVSCVVRELDWVVKTLD